MPMPVMRIRRMGVPVSQRCVTVSMAVFAVQGLIMHLGVMSVVIAVSVLVLVLEFSVHVRVLVVMGFRLVQHHTAQHQDAANRRRATD